MKDKNEFQAVTPFLLAAMFWLVVAVPICWLLSPSGASPYAAMKWTAGLWLLCMVDLAAMTKSVASALRLMTASAQERGPLTVQLMYWGALKFACLGIFAVILIKGRSIPGLSLFLGIATLIVTPLLGGLWWSQKELHHA